MSADNKSEKPRADLDGWWCSNTASRLGLAFTVVLGVPCVPLLLWPLVREYFR